MHEWLQGRMGAVSRTVLSPDVWRARRHAHRERVDRTLAGHRERADHHVLHPVEDFLFEYYRTKPVHLSRWSPGHGVVLGGEPVGLDQLPLQACDGGHEVDAAALEHRRDGLAWIHTLLQRTGTRAPSFGCFGLHEWAMLHRTDQPRHRQLGLRLDADEVARIVEERGVRCTHVDAFRFFTPSARPLNQRPLSRATQIEDDQPGCLHVTMDLYKWATKLGPLAPSELVMDCFDLAMDVRWVDMRASPYDLGALPDPAGQIRTTAAIPIETPRGRADYVELQQGFSERAVPLRSRLTQVYGSVLDELTLATR